MTIFVFFFDCGVSIREKIFEADICCVEFLGRSIGTISLSPPPPPPPKKKDFSGIIQDLGPFMESPFWPVTGKRLIFELWFGL